LARFAVTGKVATILESADCNTPVTPAANDVTYQSFAANRRIWVRVRVRVRVG